MSKNSKSPFSQISISLIIMYMKRHTYLSVAVVSWAAMVVLLVVLVIPQIQLVVSETRQISDQQKKLADATGRVAFLQALNVKDLTDDQTLLQAVLPSQKPVTPLISSVEKLASDAQVTLKNFELSPGSVATNSASSALTAVAKGFVPGVTSLPLKLEVQGGFSQMNVFFKSLDTLVPLVNVKTINFTQVSQNGTTSVATAQYKASVELESLYALASPTGQVIDQSTPLTSMTAQDKDLLLQLGAQVASQPSVAQTVFTSDINTVSGTRSNLFSY